MNIRAFISNIKEFISTSFQKYDYYIYIASITVIISSIIILCIDIYKNWSTKDEPTPPNTPVNTPVITKENIPDIKKEELSDTKDLESQKPIEKEIIKDTIINNESIEGNTIEEPKETKEDIIAKERKTLEEALKDTDINNESSEEEIEKKFTHVENLEESRKTESKKGFLSKYFFGY